VGYHQHQFRATALHYFMPSNGLENQTYLHHPDKTWLKNIFILRENYISLLPQDYNARPANASRTGIYFIFCPEDFFGV
jgi:hypothetical protein